MNNCDDDRSMKRRDKLWFTNGCTPGASHRQPGFTLVELLVALVLSSIIFISAYQVISNLIQYQVRAQQQQGGELDRWLMINFLSQIIEKAVPQIDLPYRFNKTTVFRGEPDRLTLISRAYSGNFDLPGHRSYRLFERGGELWVAYRAYDKEYLTNREYESETGLEISVLRFEYLSQQGWVDRWQDAKNFPRQIRVSAVMPGAEKIELVRVTRQR
ncbi:MAG: prepilin-type N-terminal cleavage/methylation domain-containing protein [Gammaproteobacteria bacterium]|nr:prepilin-type N-terminal cleavage/methylation domain-containing protein [Gammaproteobacteria bacterium]